jgi:hypothetical protein
MNDYTDWMQGSTSKGTVVSCFASHPALPIGEYKIYGGSCLRPIVLDAEVYIGFDHGMSLSKLSWPWDKHADEVYFNIPDMKAPSSAADFKKLLHWTSLQLIAGKKVHAGCIGGHGRTGTFFAALVTYMTGELDSITYVRKHYCTKAVESFDQIEFLNKNFSITRVDGSKLKVKPPTKATNVASAHPAPKLSSVKKTSVVQCVPSKLSIWQ